MTDEKTDGQKRRKRGLCVLTKSELGTLWACPWKHNLRYEKGLTPAGGEERTGARSIGSLVHIGLAAAYSCVMRFQALGVTPALDAISNAARSAMDDAGKETAEESSQFEGEDAEALRDAEAEDRVSAGKCVDLFVEHVVLRNAQRYRVVGVEVPFRVPLLTPAGRRWGDELEGVIDVVTLDDFGQLVVEEHKTTVSDASTYEERMLSTDPQLPLYIGALRSAFGRERVKGSVLLNVVRKSYPRPPSTNKDGSVSTAACDTTRAIYQEALDLQGEPDWLVKRRKEYDAAMAGGDPKKMTKATEAKQKAEERWVTLCAKQKARLAGLPNIERFVAQHEWGIPSAAVDRAMRDAWTACRVVRLYRRGALTPWRNGSACEMYGRRCAYFDACVEGVSEPGEFLVAREARHTEVDEARLTSEGFDAIRARLPK
jgi:hypothetical protein